MGQNTHNILFRLKDIYKIFRNGFRINYNGTMAIRKKCFTFIIGKSGVGKSTLLNFLGLLDKAEPAGKESFLEYHRDANSVINYFENHLNGQKTSLIRCSDFGFLPQDGHLLNTFSIWENLDLVCNLRYKEENSKPTETILNALKKVNLNLNGERLRFSPFNLSGGQKQRLALARTILGDPKVIFVDEPTTYMDPDNVKLTMEILLDHVISHGSSIIVVTHDYNELYGYLNGQNNSVNIDTFHLKDSQKGNIWDVSW
jgi:putative ABC transport system ATP-binding protein